MTWGCHWSFTSGTCVITQVLMETYLYWTALIVQKSILASGAELYSFEGVQWGSVGRSCTSSWHCSWELRWAECNYWKWQLPDSQNACFVHVASLRSLDHEKLWRLLFYGLIPRWGICSDSLENGVTYGIALNHRICLHSHVEPLWYITLNIPLKACKLQRARLCTKIKAIKKNMQRREKRKH
jgi:hypothetical protein